MFGVTSSSVVTANLPVAQALPRWSPINMTFGNKESYTVSSYSSGPSYFSAYATFDVNDPYVSSSSGLSFSLWNWELKLSTGWKNLGISLSYTNENTTYSMALKANLSELNVSAENAVTVKWDDSSHTTYANISVSGYLILGAYCFAATGQLPSTSSPGVIYGS